MLRCTRGDIYAHAYTRAIGTDAKTMHGHTAEHIRALADIQLGEQCLVLAMMYTHVYIGVYLSSCVHL